LLFLFCSFFFSDLLPSEIYLFSLSFYTLGTDSSCVVHHHTIIASLMFHLSVGLDLLCSECFSSSHVIYKYIFVVRKSGMKLKTLLSILLITFTICM
jgi:hypothetical protein